jgi:Bacterial Ig-like domain
MKRAKILLCSSLFILAFINSILFSSCGQLGYLQGGAKDTLAPKLVKASPQNNSTNVKSPYISFTFDEYIDLQDLQQNLLISPLQSKNPNITANPKTINFKFRDSLLPNTTYTINFGNAIKDINENNVLKNFSYVFTTGNKLDSATISGNVILAETGKIDSNIIVMLYSNLDDSLVKTKKPNYITKIKSDGSFLFTNLPSTNFKVYALLDGDGSKTYNTDTEVFAFADNAVSASKSESISLFAYAAKNKIDNKAAPAEKQTKEKKLTYSTNIFTQKDLLEPSEIQFNNKLASLDSNKIYLVDTFFKKISNLAFTIDSSKKKITINNKWKPETNLILIIDSNAVKDTFGKSLSKADTIKFVTKKVEDYGRITFRFNDLDLSKNPVLEFVQNDEIKYVYILKSKEWSNSMFPPGDYDIRILYDTDKNGKWTPGNFAKKQQPEIALTLPQKLTIKADWDNERDINL